MKKIALTMLCLFLFALTSNATGYIQQTIVQQPTLIQFVPAPAVATNVQFGFQPAVVQFQPAFATNVQFIGGTRFLGGTRFNTRFGFTRFGVRRFR